MVKENGSAVGVGMEVGVGVAAPVPKKGTVGPRIVRNVSTQMQRKRSNSVPPLEAGSNSISITPSSSTTTTTTAISTTVARTSNGDGRNGGLSGVSPASYGSLTGSMIDLRVQGGSGINGIGNGNGLGRPHMNGDARKQSHSSVRSRSSSKSAKSSGSSTIITSVTTKGTLEYVSVPVSALSSSPPASSVCVFFPFFFHVLLLLVFEDPFSLRVPPHT